MDAVRQGTAGCLTQATGSRTVGTERSFTRHFFLPALLALSWPTVLWAQEPTPDETLRRQQERMSLRKYLRMSISMWKPERLPRVGCCASLTRTRGGS